MLRLSPQHDDDTMNTTKTFDEACEKLAKEVADLIVKKQHDYGKGNILKYEEFMKKLLGEKYRAGAGILARLNDKMERLKNLYAKGDEPKNESIEDTFKDIIGYSIVALLLLRKQFKLPLK